MARNILSRTAPAVGTDIIEGYEVLANFRDRHVLARSRNVKNPEPFVVWTLDDDGDPHTGTYCVTLQTAEVEFVERCFPWFWETPAAKAQEAAQEAEHLIDFTEEYDTHRVGFYKEWMIVQPFDEMGGEILCYLPSDEWDSSDFPDLEYLKGYYTPEWTASNLNEAMEFIDGYDEFEQVNAESLD